MEVDIIKIEPESKPYNHKGHSVEWVIGGQYIIYNLICDHRKEGQCELAEFIENEFNCDEFVEGYVGPDMTLLRSGKIEFTIDEDGIFWSYAVDVSDKED